MIYVLSIYLIFSKIWLTACPKLIMWWNNGPLMKPQLLLSLKTRPKKNIEQIPNNPTLPNRPKSTRNPIQFTNAFLRNFKIINNSLSNNTRTLKENTKCSREGAVHKLCRLINWQSLTPSPPLSSFLLSKVYLVNCLWGYPPPSSTETT